MKKIIALVLFVAAVTVVSSMNIRVEVSANQAHACMNSDDC